MKITVREIIFAIIIAAVLAGLDLFVLPASLFVAVGFADVEPIYITLIINQWILIVAGLIAVRYLCPNLTLGLRKLGAKAGFKRFLVPTIIITLIAGFAYYIGLLGNYNYNPTIWKVLIEIFIYNISVGIIEELYVRGLLLNSIERMFHKKKNAAFIAILISSLVFSIGHLPGMLGQGALIIILRLVWTLMIGIYFGVIYKKTKNLWVPIVSHIILNFSGLAFCFTTERAFPLISVIIIALAFSTVALWSVYYYFKDGKTTEKPAK